MDMTQKPPKHTNAVLRTYYRNFDIHAKLRILSRISDSQSIGFALDALCAASCRGMWLDYANG